MKYVYTLIDTKSGIPCPPFLAENDDVAKRTIFLSIRKAGEIPPVLFPDDFSLVKIADWTERGERPLNVLDVPQNVGTVKQIINSIVPPACENLDVSKKEAAETVKEEKEDNEDSN